MKTSSREIVLRHLQQRLPGRFASPESMEADHVFVEIDFSANEAMRPVAVHGDGASQQTRPGGIVGSPQENHSSVQLRLKIQFPVFREPVSRGRCFDPGSRAKLTQRAGLVECFSQRQDQLFNLRRDLVGRLPPPTPSGTEIDAVETPTCGPTHPILHGLMSNAEPLRHGASRGPWPNCRSHPPATLFDPCFSSRTTPSRSSRKRFHIVVPGSQVAGNC